MSRPATPPTPPPADQDYPSCTTTLWQLGPWRCDYSRPAGEWRASSIRLYRNERLVRTAAFGLAASAQASTWRAAVEAKPDRDPR